MLIERDADWVEAKGGDPSELVMLADDLDGDIPTMRELKHESRYELCLGLIKKCNGNVTQAANLAKHDRKEFYYYVTKRCGI